MYGGTGALTQAGKLGRNIGACSKKPIFQSSFVIWCIDRCIVTVFVEFYINKPFILRTVPPFVTAQMFCASRDIRVSLEISPVIQQHFCAVYDRVEKQISARAIRIQKENNIVGGNHAFFRDN